MYNVKLGKSLFNSFHYLVPNFCQEAQRYFSLLQMKWILCNRAVIYPFLAPIKLLISRVSTGNEFHVLYINVLPCNCLKFVASKICWVLVLRKIFWSSHLCGILFSLISVLMSSSTVCIFLSFFLLPLLPASHCFHMFETSPFASDPFWKK